MSSGFELKPTSNGRSLEGLNSVGRIEAMVDWFHQNFEDPAMETPYESAEGGYIYVWGGPYDAAEELYDAFPDAPEEDVVEAVRRIQSDGLFDWAPHGGRIQSDEFEYDGVGNAYVSDDYVEPDYFAADDISSISIEDRLIALASQLDRIEAHVAYWRNRPPGMGHNGAPNEFRIGPDDQDLVEVEESVHEVREQLSKPDAANTADVEVLERAEGRFRRLAAKIRGWAKKAAAALLLGAAGAAGKAIAEEAIQNPHAFLSELEQAVSNVAHWVAHIHPF